LSQEALAKRAGLSLRAISDLERGVKRAPHLTTVRLIADALGVGPEERTALIRAARPKLAPIAQEDFRLAPAPLPVPLTRLIGRDDELAALTSMLVSGGGRLVTVTGAGGTGKTRLALEIAARLTGDFPDGAVFVDLAPLSDASLVVPTIARAVGLRERGGEWVSDTLARLFATKRMLLAIDNVEHVIAAAVDLAALLAASPSVAMLATSREALAVRGEWELRLQPLSLPATKGAPLVEAVAMSPAVALFVERAAAHQPGFALTDDNAADVVAICRRLDGLPLAIELAAARIRLLPPAALLSRLERPLPLLRGGSRDLPVRQRTMRSAIAWSYDLLGESEQRLFRRLAVFSGGWTLQAAEQVAGDESLDALSGLEALDMANLVRAQQQSSGEVRFSMLETVREFGLERLADHDELDEVGHRHAQHFQALARSGESDPAEAKPGSWLVSIESDEANLRTALAWLREQQEGADGLRLATAMGEFWRLRSRNAEGREWLETFLTLTASDPSVAGGRIVALRWAGELAGLQGDAAVAEARLTESLALAREVGDARSLAGVLGAIGSARLQSGDVAGSIAPFLEAITLSRELEDRRQTAFLLAYVAVAVGNQGDVARAEELVAESEQVLRELGDTLSFETSLVALVEGLLALMQCDEERGEEQFATARARGNALGAKAISAVAAAGLGEIELARGHVAAAASRFRNGLDQGWEGDFPLGIAWSLGGLARIGGRRGAWSLTARLFGAAEPYWAAMQALPKPVTKTQENDVARTREALGDEAFRAAFSAGRSVPLEEIIAEANPFADKLCARHD
jgi:predicted ATPase/transcriptional regulator with XRE-family HTH domain